MLRGLPPAPAALLVDAALGEPPEGLHPTVWMGRAIAAFERRATKLQSPVARAAAGAGVSLLLPTCVFFAARRALRAAPRSLRWPAEVALLSTALSARGLGRAARGVEDALRAGDLRVARERVGEFVGRDTGGLSEGEVARAAVESVAENASDGVFAPMLYGSLLGAPGALSYKAVNTLDSMLGHPSYGALGWAPARLDDLANLPAARLTALLAAIASGRPALTLRVARRYGPLTRSPNAGWAEAAFAGALGLKLGGTNFYGGEVRPGPLLGEGRAPTPRDIGRSVRLLWRCGALLALFLAVPALLAGISRRG